MQYTDYFQGGGAPASGSNLESPAIEIIQGKLQKWLCKTNVDKLYWLSGNRPPTSESSAYYFSVDNVRARRSLGCCVT
jgi:hypothetical protein